MLQNKQKRLLKDLMLMNFNSTHGLYKLCPIFFLITIFSLSSCSNISFKPLYGNNSEKSSQSNILIKDILADIYIEQIKNRQNQLVRNQLLLNFNSTSNDINSKYTLKTSSRISSGNYFGRNYNSLNRYLAIGSANFQLYENLSDSEKPLLLFKGTEKAQATYHTTNHSFNNRTASQDANKRVAIELANNITLAISSYFYKKSTN